MVKLTDCYYKYNIADALTKVVLLAKLADANGLEELKTLSLKANKFYQTNTCYFSHISTESVYKNASEAVTRDWHKTEAVKKMLAEDFKDFIFKPYNKEQLVGYEDSKLANELKLNTNVKTYLANGIVYDFGEIFVFASEEFNSMVVAKVVKDTDFYLALSHNAYDEDWLNTLAYNVLIETLSVKIPETNVFMTLRDLWVEQFKEMQVKYKDLETNTLLQTLLNYVYQGLDFNKDHDILVKITYYEFIKFYEEVKQGKLSDETQNIQDWMLGSSSVDSRDSALNLILNNEDMAKQMKRLKSADAYEATKLINNLNKSKDFKNRFEVADVIEINDDFSKELSASEDAKYTHETVLHGTTTKSVISILLRGLIPSNELSKLTKNDNSHLSSREDIVKVKYKYSGSALGQGVYFARLHQARKSANFVSGAHYAFMFVADVRYRKSHTKYVDGFVGEQGRNLDAVIANSVGFNGDSELCIKHSSDIALKYLVVLTKTSDR